jgi:hypothetical protein
MAAVAVAVRNAAAVGHGVKSAGHARPGLAAWADGGGVGAAIRPREQELAVGGADARVEDINVDAGAWLGSGPARSKAALGAGRRKDYILQIRQCRHSLQTKGSIA